MANELTTQNTISNFRAFATAARAKAHFEGTRMKFIRGDWIANEEKMNGAHLLARIDRLAVGWTKWIGRKPVDFRIGFVAEGFKPPQRSELDDLEEGSWPRDSSGKRRDPWQFGMHLQLVEPESGEVFVFSTGTQGGKDMLANLSDAYADRLAKQPDGKLPEVGLSADAYHHKGHNTEVDVPMLDIIGWTDPPDDDDERPELPSAPMEGPTKLDELKGRDRGDMDDEIPF